MSEPFPRIAGAEPAAPNGPASGSVLAPRAGARLRTGVVLIGAPETVRSLHAQMAAAGVRIIPTGAVLLQPPLKFGVQATATRGCQLFLSHL